MVAGMRSTIAVFVIVFSILGLLLGFSESYDAPEKSLTAASKININFYNNSAESLCPDNPRKDAKPGVDWSGCTFYSQDLSGANLSGAKLRSTGLVGSLLEDANLSGADLSNADLTIAYLSGADLSRANLSNANLLGADLSGAKLDGANLQGANLDCRGHPVCKQ